MSKISMNLKAWSYEDYIQFIQAYQTGKTGNTFDLVRKLIVKWDYSVDLGDPNAMLRLSVYDSAEVVRTVFESLSDYIENMDTKEVVVDFKAWDTGKLLKFDKLRVEGKFKPAQEMLFEVATLEGVNPNEPLNFPDGALMYKAVNDAYAKVVSGKN